MRQGERRSVTPRIVGTRLQEKLRQVSLLWFALFLSLALAGVARAEVAKPADTQKPPSILFGPLFERVALSDIFPDGKTWADAQPLETPSDILTDYRRENPRTRTELKNFVDEHFSHRTGATAGISVIANLPLRAHIESLWPLLTRTSSQSAAFSSLLPLPQPYIVPGGRFTEVYYWDSYFTMLGLDGPHAGLRRHMVDNFAYLIKTFGHVPNGNRTYYLSRSQPPFFFKMVELIDPQHPSRAFARYLSALRREHDWWMRGVDTARINRPSERVVRLPDGSLLNRYWDDRDVPRDESYQADFSVAAGRPNSAGIYRDLRAGAESGWDYSSRWFADGKSLETVRTTEIVPPDLNSLLYGLELAIADGCEELEDSVCTTDFRARARARAGAMRRYLWNAESGVFDDYSWKDRHLIGNLSAASLYPLFVGLATRGEADSTAKMVEQHLLKKNGIVTTTVDTGQQWDAPNGWAPLQWIAVEGLRSYDHDDLARTIAQRWLTTVASVYDETGKLLEKYNVVTRRPGGGGEYPLQDGFGWTNGTTIALMRMYPGILDERRGQPKVVSSRSPSL